MDISPRIAFRYIFTFRSFHFITFITLISFIGIVVGIAALICVLSIFNGFREFTENQLIGFDPHIRVSAKKGAWIENPDSLIKDISKLNSIISAYPTIKERIVLSKGTNLQVAQLNTFRMNQQEQIQGIKNKILFGKFYNKNVSFIDRVYIGIGLADRLRIFPGDTISIMSPSMIESSVRTLNINSGISVLVQGIFQTNIKDYDERFVYSENDLGKKLFKIDNNKVSCIDITLNSIKNSEEVKSVLSSIFGNSYSVETWYDLHKELFNIMKFERIVTFFVLSLIVVIAVFNILASLVMTVVEKKSDIAVLKAIGATDKTIRKIFLWEGFIIGLASSIIGSLLGLLLSLGQMNYGWFKLDTSKYLIDAIPISINYIDIIIIFAFALGLSLIATIYPAYRASKTIISEEIRTE